MNRRTFIKAGLALMGLGLMELSEARYNSIRSIFYWNLHSPPEGLDGAVKIIEDLHAEFIWYAHWMVGFPMPPDLKDAKEIARDCGLDENYARKFMEWCRNEYYALKFVEEQVDAIKERIYCPAILGYTNFRIDFNFDPVTFDPISREEIWNEWLLNFGKWDIKNPKTGKTFTVEETQKLFWDIGLPRHNGIPDYSNPKVIKYYVNRAKAFRNAGATAIWYDLFFGLPLKLKKVLRVGFDHEMIRDLYEGCCKIIEGAKSLGLTVGTWVNCLYFPYKNSPKVDFVTESPSENEVLNMALDQNRWRYIESVVEEKKPNAWLLIVFDFGPKDYSPLPLFSQKLSPTQQRKFLKIIWNLVNELSVNSTFAFPVHGPGLGKNPRKLAWGKYKYYDARAPEFNTYTTIIGILKSLKNIQTPHPTQKTPSISIVGTITALALAAVISKYIKKL